jgi:NitT/TauT family transport system ATP-binding protein
MKRPSDGHLCINSISKSYLSSGININVLNDFSLNVNRAEFISILGPSGCGKSTLLKICSSLIMPDSGDVKINGVCVNRPDRNRILMLQDDNQLFPWLTVKANVSFSAKLSGSDRKESNIHNLLEMAGLSDYSEYYPHQLSGGMKKRTSLARALAGNPGILFMDEPFGSLDAKKKIILQKFLLDIWNKYKVTILFVTHDIHEAIRLGQRIVIINDTGNIVCDEKINGLENRRLSEDVSFKLYRKYYRLLTGSMIV